jgi:PGF-pre-PGF domain-containing protein
MPVSEVDAITPYWQTQTPFTITATASDLDGHVTNVALWYRYSTDNSSWTSWTLFGADLEEPGSWSFTTSRGDGYYEFFSIARDNDANEEPAKLRAEARCGVDTTAPSAPELVSPTNGARTRNTIPTFDWSDVTDFSGVIYEFTIEAYDSPVLTKSCIGSAYAIKIHEALPEGTYHWRVRTIDGAGNFGDWSETRSFTIELVPPITVNLGTVHAGTPQVADFTQYNVFMIKVTIITLRNVDNVEIYIKESIGKPAWVSEPSGTMYSIYATVTTNIASSDISSAVILFQLPKSWILQNEIDAGTTTLLRTGSDWHTLPTTPVGGDENYSYFDATTTGFSLFVATGEKASIPTLPTPSELPLLPIVIISIISMIIGGVIAYYLLRPFRQFTILKRLERAVVRPRKRQIGELEVEPPARVRKRAIRTDSMALGRLERTMRERRKKWTRETRKKSVNKKVKLGKVKQKKLAKGRMPVRVRRRVGPTDQVALGRLERTMRERRKKWTRETRKKSVNKKVKLGKVKQKKLAKGRKRSKPKR